VCERERESERERERRQDLKKGRKWKKRAINWNVKPLKGTGNSLYTQQTIKDPLGFIVCPAF